MGTLADFFAQNIVVIYFLYGLAFFGMGLAVLLESARSSDLRLARALRPLGAFGLMHGAHEWGEMFQRIAAAMTGYRLSPQELAFEQMWLVASFAALAVFGTMLIVPGPGERAPGAFRHWAPWWVPALLVTAWLAGLPLLWAFAGNVDQWLAAADVWARYTVGIPASLLAAWGLVRQQRAFREQRLASFGRDCLWAAVAFGWYGLVGQFFAPPSVLFPSNVVNSEVFQQLFGVPVQLFRAVVAALAAFFVVRFLRAFEVARARRLQELQDAHVREVEEREARRGDLLRQIVTAQEAERERVARELHDETGQALTGLGLGLRGVRASLQKDPAMAERHVVELEAMAGRALDELRRLIADLRPSHLDDLGLVAALRWYAREVQASAGVEVSVEAQNPKVALRPELATVLFRIGQEAINNVVRHADAKHATVRLCCDDDEVRLIVTDDGRGFQPDRVLAPQRDRHSWGLVGMQERAALVGGRLSVHSAPGQGTEILVVVPTDRTCADGKDQTAAG